jgi:hypothetical protein
VCETMPWSTSIRLAASLIDLLNTQSGRQTQLYHHGEYFDELPMRLGHHGCLDLAVEYLLLTQRHSGNWCAGDAAEAFEVESQALQLLQDDLCNTKSAVKHEILCAILVHATCTVSVQATARIMLTCFWTVIPGFERPVFQAHIGGAAALMHKYGSECLSSNRFALQLFYAAVPSMVRF